MLEKMHLQRNLYVTLILGSRSQKKVPQYPLHYATYGHATFEAASSYSLGGDAFARKYIIRPLHRCQCHIKRLHHMTYVHVKFVVPMSNCFGDDCNYKYVTDGRLHDYTLYLLQASLSLHMSIDVRIVYCNMNYIVTVLVSCVAQHYSKVV